MARRELSLWVIVTISLAVTSAAQAQSSDSLSGGRINVSPHSPTGALWRSAVVPGWGQIYNHQYLKAPVVIAALGGLIALVSHNDNQFDRYNHAYLYGAYLGEDIHPFPEYEMEYLAFPGISTSSLRSRRDQFRRNRDLTIIGLIAAYGLNLLDAYVSGQLFDFDVSEDLSALDGAPFLPARMSLRIHF